MKIPKLEIAPNIQPKTERPKTARNSAVGDLGFIESSILPISPSSQEIEKKWEEAKKNAEINAEESKREMQSVIDRLGLEIGDKKLNSFAIASATLGKLSGGVLKSPLESSLLQRRSQSK